MFRFGVRFAVLRFAVLLFAVLVPGSAFAEVTGVTITSRSVVAGGQAFGNTGSYEKLAGRIEFALDPANPHNRRIADLDLAPRAADGRVHFSADLYILQPLDSARGNGTLLFEIANRGRKGLLASFNGGRTANDFSAPGDFGDGFLMKEGYTLVWVGWQFDVAPPALRVEAPRADLKSPDTVRITFIVDERENEAPPAGLPTYMPVAANDPSATLTVRDRFWDSGRAIERSRWSLAVGDDGPRVRLDGGFDPGRVYELAYPSTDARVAGVGMAAVRDAASAFVRRGDLPIHGRRAYVYGLSQSGRFLRQFLVDGFNVNEHHQRVFDAVWAHIAGAGLGSFNERFAMPGYSSFPATRFPFTDREQTFLDGQRGGLLAGYRPEQQPKLFFTNTPVEYWGQGRAAALTHTSIDGSADRRLADNVRMYLLAGSQHVEGAFPPTRGLGQELGNPTPQRHVMRALLRAMDRWATADVRPPESRYPRLADRTLTKVSDARFPAIPRVADPRTVEGPAQIVNGRVTPLPFLVPQVDSDGNDVAGIRVPEVAVPLATTTGWNFRTARAGNPSTIVSLAGSYIPFARTKAERTARRDPRLSIEERYRGRDEYLKKIRAAADALVTGGYLLAEDLDAVVERASAHWDYATL